MKVWLSPLLGLFLLGLGGCGILDEGKPDKARVIIEGATGEEFNLLTSNDFLVIVDQNGENREVVLNSSDTALVSTPFNQQYRLGSGERLYVKVFRDTALSEPINVRILVGGDERFNSTSTLENLTLEFIYTIR
jgi:hypothetical protein